MAEITPLPLTPSLPYNIGATNTLTTYPHTRLRLICLPTSPLFSKGSISFVVMQLLDYLRSLNLASYSMALTI
jgi:hypothetical protein